MNREEMFNYSKKHAIAEVVERYFSEKKTSFANLLEQILDCIMRNEREIFLSKDSSNKANGFYPRSLSTALGKLDISVPRDRKGEFRASILPEPWVRSTKSYKNLLLSSCHQELFKNHFIFILKQLRLPY
ncbi:MAG: hypothetical protein D6734_00890 [Candidatus Schekmanbacteria bacterium]|nr:MAG: hypothetical protein D6734_00890 [Candidatus Schekmanbacteria bacterium]